jgi:uncharacterized protein
MVDSPSFKGGLMALERLLLQALLDWKQQPTRKPLLLDGARQVGKSYLLKELFGRAHFAAVYTVDFLENPRLSSLFAGGLDPEQILNNLEIHFGATLNLATDLLLFDEIGECQAAVDSLKYFAERLPTAYLCASGSNIGLLNSFPVGKVHSLELLPLNFEEFLLAAGNAPLIKAFRTMSRQLSVHEQLWQKLLEYYFVGGMPEAVAAWVNSSGGIFDKTVQIKQIHRNLIGGYQRDFGKYAGKTNAQQIEAVFRNVPRQLSSNLDESVQRYRFNDAVANKRRYAELRGPIDWLTQSKLVSKCFVVTSQPQIPLEALVKDNIFKLFFFDIGLLSYLLQLTYADQLAQKISYKGYLAENFVQNELRACGYSATYSWEAARSQIEFLYKAGNGDIMPVEVKSGSRTRAKSLVAYVDRYAPARTLKLVGTAGGTSEGPQLVWPLYYAQYLAKL